MKVILERDAETELVDAALYYNEQQPGLGSDFLDRTDAAMDEIAADPLRFGFYRGSKRIRSVRLARFPYRLLFSVNSNKVSVVAVAHLHRQPDYWKHRVT